MTLDRMNGLLRKAGVNPNAELPPVPSPSKYTVVAYGRDVSESIHGSYGLTRALQEYVAQRRKWGKSRAVQVVNFEQCELGNGNGLTEAETLLLQNAEAMI